ncbi:MAG: TerC/Alx family metal homeostasis membrane protein [Candidatus Nitrosocaldaceae archaeon]
MITEIDWITFHVIIGVLLLIDLLFHKKDHIQTFKEALIWSIIWIAAASIFILYIFDKLGAAYSLEYTTAYVIEKMLSVDNLFVFAVIFAYFGIHKKYEHKILFYGVIGAIVARAVFMVAGIHLLENFHFMTYIFGAVLIYTGIRLLRSREMPTDPAKNPIIRYVKKVFPVVEEPSDRFIVRSGTIAVTPLFVTLIAVESTDILFAIDSVPAVLAVTDNLFVAYTSNIFAVLGLRSLYFLLINVLERLKYLHVGLFVLLLYLGAKMIASNFIEIPTVISLVIVASILTITTLISLKSHK